MIKTPFHDKTPPERMQAMLNSVPMARLGAQRTAAARYCSWRQTP
ncbi:MAG: hypothetical protein WDN06_18300 [Asticcacaulis sp.]